MPQNELLFLLQPENREALEIVLRNPSYCTEVDDAVYLVFHADRRSKTAGNLATFGRHDNNDIILPSVRTENPSERKEKYNNHHFAFFLEPKSGELIIKDFSNRRTVIEVGHASPEDAVRYALHGTKPRQRVIPRMDREIYLTFGRLTKFALFWAPNLIEPTTNLQQQSLQQQSMQRQLFALAQVLAATGMTMTSADSRQSDLTPSPHARYELRSRHTPSVGVGNIKPYHAYRKLGSGSFGTVSKVVDLSTGELLAMKELREGKNDDAWKKAFKDEVEIIAKITHAHIAEFVSHQEFNLGGRFKIFFRLYDGSLADILPKHRCNGALSGIPNWAGRFLQQTLSALAYLHGQDIIHRDIKPDNILYNNRNGQYSFYVADFGLSVSVTDAIRASRAGTRFYMAPEVILKSQQTVLADTWSFGIMLGRVLGYWCESETEMKSSQWREKLTALGAKVVVFEDARNMATDDINIKVGLWMERTFSVVNHDLLPEVFKSMLCHHPFRKSISKLQQLDWREFVERPVSFNNTIHGEWHLPARTESEMSIDIPPPRFY